jgi:hypothetical protein
MVSEYLNKLYRGRSLISSVIEWAEAGDVETSQRILRELTVFLVSIEDKRGTPHGDKDSY